MRLKSGKAVDSFWSGHEPVPNKISEHRVAEGILSMPIDTKRAAQQQAFTGHRDMQGFAPSTSP
jgi:hypothetical protein